MSESFLHYLWQFQYFAKTDLYTTSGEEIIVFNPGYRNTHAGPDFQQARIRIGPIEWIGTVEIHIHASGWHEHQHDTDKAYDTVVLHVVWKDDRPVRRSDGSLLPTLELKDRVDEQFLLDYKKMVNSPEKIPCASALHEVPELIKLSMLDKSLATRLETKSIAVGKLLQRNGNNWEETCYQLLAKNFGFKVNADPFLQLAQGLPLKILLKHADKSIQLEALLFGQAGFLEDEKLKDEYYAILRREYSLLQQKYSLAGSRLNKVQWKFLRLRPANFPTVRLAQLSTLVHVRQNIFSKIIAASSYEELRHILTIRQPEYWRQHYQFAKRSKTELSALGEMSINMIIINTIVPLLVAYGKLKDEQYFVDHAISMLQHVPTEMNIITRQWASLGIKSKTAFDSQALLELHHHYCLRHRCLECTIGASLLKPASR
jgi:hypothetical protein